jgi:hypothetical protein
MNIQEFRQIIQNGSETPECSGVKTVSSSSAGSISGLVHCPYIPAIANISADKFKRTTKIQMVNGDVIELDDYQYALITPLMLQNNAHKYDFAVKVMSESRAEFDHLYVTDELISGRINWSNPSKEIEITYFTVKDLNIPWWKFWVDKNVLVNIKNKQLWQEAVAIAHIKRLPPVPPPVMKPLYFRGIRVHG